MRKLYAAVFVSSLMGWAGAAPRGPAAEPPPPRAIVFTILGVRLCVAEVGHAEACKPAKPKEEAMRSKLPGDGSGDRGPGRPR